MSDTNEIIKKMFSTRWSGYLSTGGIEDMRSQLRKNLQNQIDGYWSGSSAYRIMVEGGFLIDSKRIPIGKAGMCKGKKLTALGELFMESWSK